MSEEIDIESIPFNEEDLPEELRTPVEELNPIKVKRKFLGIWIPREIWLSEDLTMQEKVFIVEINSLDNDKGCFASNAYFGKFFGLSVTRVSHIVNSLVEKEWVTSHLTYKENSKEVDRRTLKIKEKRKEVLNNNIT